MIDNPVLSAATALRACYITGTVTESPLNCAFSGWSVGEILYLPCFRAYGVLRWFGLQAAHSLQQKACRVETAAAVPLVSNRCLSARLRPSSLLHQLRKPNPISVLLLLKHQNMTPSNFANRPDQPTSPASAHSSPSFPSTTSTASTSTNNSRLLKSTRNVPTLLPVHRSHPLLC